MNAATRLSAFGAAVAVAFTAAWTVGRLAGPIEPTLAAEHVSTPEHASTPNTAAGEPLPGLASSANGYRLVAESTLLPAATARDFRFRIVDSANAPITRFTVEHDKLMHLVVVRRDGVHYQHLHPQMSQDGTWSVPLKLPAAGGYRVFADFHPQGGEPATLGVDVHVAGDYQPASSGAESRTFTVDGYQVRLDGAAGATLTATVTRAGKPVTDLQPYLGAYGHLVALRGGDLAYLHVHPEAAATPGPHVRFTVEFPTAGRYRLFLDFRHGSVVRTAEFTVDTEPGDGHGHG